MKALVQEKEKAIQLRRKGLCYRDILKQIPVAKSSLSLWLKDLPLTKDEKYALKKRKDSNISRGRIKAASANHSNRLERDKKVAVEAKIEFGHNINDSLFHTGIALYWAEGAKRSDTFHFTNSDADMMCVMLKWLERFTMYNRIDLGYRLYIHKPYAHMDYERVWAKKLSVTLTQFKKTVIKPTSLGHKKRPSYEGCLRIEVPRSGQLLLKMKTWIKLLVEYERK